MNELHALNKIDALIESIDAPARARVLRFIADKYLPSYKAKYRSANKCADCKEPATHGVRCAKHAEINRTRARKKRGSR